MSNSSVANWVGNTDNLPAWYMLHVECEAPGFGEGYTVALGVDNTKPGESLRTIENRIAERFDVPAANLIIRISNL